MSVWTTTNTGLDTVLATTLGAASTVLGQSSVNHQHPALTHSSRPRTPLTQPPLHKSLSQHNLPKTNNIQHLTLNLREESSCCHRSNGSGSSPIIHNCGHSHQATHHNSINQFHPAPGSQYTSSQNLFAPNSNVAFGWSKSGAIYQHKVSEITIY